MWLCAAPQSFYVRVPGVAATGPQNAHLLRDVGIAYAGLGLGFARAFSDLSRARIATIAAAFYLGAHAVLHAAMEASHAQLNDVRTEAPGIYLPAALAAGIALRFAHVGRGRRKAGTQARIRRG